jgi:GH35 family endo-1,4-beta-xylanase
MFPDLVVGLALLRQAELLEERRMDSMAMELAPARPTPRIMLARWLHAVAARLEGQAVVFQVLNERVATAEQAHR